MKKVLVIGLLIVLFLPLLNVFVFPKIMPNLKGAFVPVELPELTSDTWFEKTYQSNYEAYISENIGFRPLMILLYNQLAYSLFNKSTLRGTIMGKNNYLFQKVYINSYYGDDFLGEDSIRAKVDELRWFRDTLESLGKSFLVCLAPSKATFCAEHIPDAMKKNEADFTNHAIFKALMQRSNINLIDFEQYFLAMKDTCDCLLYPEYGIHWSEYGMILSADTIVSRVAQLRNKPLSSIVFDSVELSDEMRGTDYDLGSSMNLFFSLSPSEMCYPKYHWTKHNSLAKPRTVVVADSYFRSMFDTEIFQHAFTPGGYWYYNSREYVHIDAPYGDVADLDLKNVFDSTDVFIIMTTPPNLSKIDHGLIEDMAEALQ